MSSEINETNWVDISGRFILVANLNKPQLHVRGPLFHL